MEGIIAVTIECDHCGRLIDVEQQAGGTFGQMPTCRIDCPHCKAANYKALVGYVARVRPANGMNQQS
jgi:phage FluMu protein Com